MSNKITLVVTVGGQPQIATFALDSLLARGFLVANIILIHFKPRDSRLQQAMDKLVAELHSRHYLGHRPKLTLYPIENASTPLSDVENASDANAVWLAIYQLIAKLKREHGVLHVCISGGRRILALLTMSAAMLHFEHNDILWHMFTPDRIQTEARHGKLMHLPPYSRFELIRVPMLPWGVHFPMLRQLAQPMLPREQDVLAAPRELLDTMEVAHCRAVTERLTPRQREVLAAFAEGITPNVVAERLNISRKTVDSHKTAILGECRNVWGISHERRLTYRFLATKFQGYFHNA